MSKSKKPYGNARSRIAAKKREIARSMVSRSASNEQIEERLVNKFGSGIATRDLAEMRREHGNGRSRNGAGNHAMVRLTPEIVAAKANGTSSEMRERLESLFAQMRLESVDALAISSDGLVRYQQTHELLLDAGGES